MKIRNCKTLTLAILTLSALLGTLPRAGATTAPTVTNLSSLSDRIGTPVRLASDSNGNLYLTDPRAGGVLKFGTDGRFLTSFATIKKPQGIAVTAAGDLVVSQGTAVSILSASGVFKSKLGKGDGQFKMANGITVDANGQIYVVDSLDNCVQVFTAAGVAVNITGSAHVAGKAPNSFGDFGTSFGQFSQPTGIAFEQNGNQLAVVDTLNSRVQFFNTSGADCRR